MNLGESIGLAILSSLRTTGFIPAAELSEEVVPLMSRNSDSNGDPRKDPEELKAVYKLLDPLSMLSLETMKETNEDEEDNNDNDN